MMTADTEQTIDAAPVANASDDIFSHAESFEDLGLRSSVLKGVHAAGFTRPTGIQAQFIPLALAGKDILGQAKTGTGKTAAFALPLLHMCKKEIGVQALVLAPTRELAIQITGEINELGRGTPIRAAAIYGGERIAKQHQKLKQNPQIIVGTPGRVLDMVGRGLLRFDNIRYAILDEVDRMLDIGFREDIRRILRKCPDQRQTMFVSATISGEIEKLARQFMNDPEKIVTSSGSLTVSLQTEGERLSGSLLAHGQPRRAALPARRVVGQEATAPPPAHARGAGSHHRLLPAQTHRRPACQVPPRQGRRRTRHPRRPQPVQTQPHHAGAPQGQARRAYRL